jgi:peptidoglycan hydrolase-like protein with peptidoglycan-binding domain
MLNSIGANPPAPGATPADSQSCYTTAHGEQDSSNAPTSQTCFWTFKSAIDSSYQHYKTNLVHAADSGNLTGDILALGLTTAGSITPGAAGARLFSALATGVLGVKSFVNEDVFFKQTITIITGEMDSDRADVFAKIEPHVQATPYDRSQMIDDLLAYYEAGTFQHALTSLQTKSGQSASLTAATPYSGQVTVTIAGSGNPKIVSTATTFFLSATIQGVPIAKMVFCKAGATVADVAAAVAKAFDGTAVTATAGPGDGTLTLKYSTSQTVAWVTLPASAITVTTETAVAPPAVAPAAAAPPAAPAPVAAVPAPLGKTVDVTPDLAANPPALAPPPAAEISGGGWSAIPANIALVQLALEKASLAAAEGHVVTVDGQLGNEVKKAVQAYQVAHHLPAMGDWNDPDTIKALGLTAPPGPATGTTDPAVITQVQRSLGGALLDLELKTKGPFITIGLSGKPDGKLGPRTIAALVVYQDAAGLPLSGVADPATLSRLAAKS